MKLWAIVFFMLPLIGAAYVSLRIWHILPFMSWIKTLLTSMVWVGLAVMVMNFVVGLDGIPLPLARVMYNVGNSWLFIMLYLFMTFLLLDILRFCHVLPREYLFSSMKGSLAIALFIISVFVYGNIHYRDKQRVTMELRSSKPLQRPLKVVMMSDLHLGYHNPRAEFARWVDMVNAEHADMILIAGDIIDISVRPLIEEDVASEFQRLNAPVYACLGNHEYYSGTSKARQFVKDAGITMLCDSSVVVDDLCIIGRDDRTNSNRKSVKQLVDNADTKHFTILLDHQPYNLEEAEQSGVDFQFSGHTHYGQVWPISWITDAVYECPFGEYQRGNTRYYVSSGIGIWGGKYRIGTHSEYIVATIK